MSESQIYDKSLILKEIAVLIKDNPLDVANALSQSNVKVLNPKDRLELIDKVSSSIIDNSAFKENISSLIALDSVNRIGSTINKDYSNLDAGYKQEVKRGGGAIARGASSGTEPISIIIGALIGSIDAAFGLARVGKDKKISKEQNKQEILNDVFSDKKKKKSKLPIFILAGVLLVGGIATYIALKE